MKTQHYEIGMVGLGCFDLVLLGCFLWKLHRNTKQLMGIIGSVDQESTIVRGVAQLFRRRSWLIKKACAQWCAS